jgi:hypothetical protein
MGKNHTFVVQRADLEAMLSVEYNEYLDVDCDGKFVLPIPAPEPITCPCCGKLLVKDCESVLDYEIPRHFSGHRFCGSPACRRDLDMKYDAKTVKVGKKNLERLHKHHAKRIKETVR